MSTFSVSSTPQQVYLGAQAAVTLYNAGPATIYLGEDSSVSPLNSMALKPTATTTWQPQQPLWVVTDSGVASLQSSPSGTTIDNSNVIPQNLLLQGQGIVQAPSILTYQSPKFECGSYQSLIFNITSLTNTILATEDNLASFQVVFNWYTDAGVYLSSTATVGAPIINLPQSLYRVTAPILASQCDITIKCIAFPDTNPNVFIYNVVGDNRFRDVSVCTTCNNDVVIWDGNRVVPSMSGTPGDRLFVMEAPVVNTEYVLPAISDYLTFSITAGIGGMATGQAFQLWSNGVAVAQVVLPYALANNQMYTKTIKMPRSYQLSMTIPPSFVNTAGNLALMWSDAPPLDNSDALTGSTASNYIQIGPWAIQWGIITPPTVTATIQTGSFSFPVAFSGQPAVTVSATGGATATLVVNGFSVGSSGFSWVQQFRDGASHTLGQPFHWIAIGPA